MNDKLRAGLAVYGSALERWDLHNFLKDAGLHINDAYTPGSRDYRVRLMSEGIREEVEVVAIRPEIAPEELWAIENDTGSRGLDIAIMGSDIAMEGERAGYPVEKLGALGMGNVDIVMAVQESMGISSLGELLKQRRGQGKPTICATEYYKYLAQKTIAEDPAYQELYPKTKPNIMVGGKVITGNNPMVVVKYSEGKTEITGVSGFSHLIMDNIQSGGTLRTNDYRVLKKLGESWYRLYAGPHITEAKNPEKYKKAILVRDLLRGKALGLIHVGVEVDFPKEKRNKIMQYLEDEKLYLIKPFIREQNGICETNIVTTRKKIAAVTEGLKDYGAVSVKTHSLETSIQPRLSDEEQDRMIETK